MEWWQYLIAIGGGALAGMINTLAGSGSAITLTILTEVLGLPGNMANGTNRVGVMTQSTAGTLSFYRNGKLDVKKSWRYIVPTVLGAIAGVITAVYISNDQFKVIFKILMILMLFIILIKPKRWLKETDQSNPPPLIIAIPIFLALGFYGGFIQMGMGVFFLASMVLIAKYSIIDTNAVKSFVVALYTIVVLAIFQYKGLIDWKIGGVLAIGQAAGGWFTAEFASKYPSANVWAYRLLIGIVFFAILKLFGVFDLLF